MRHAWSALGVVTVGITLVSTGTAVAHAEIEWASGIDGVHLGDRPRDVLQEQGDPGSKSAVHISMVGKGKVWKYGRHGRRLTVTFVDRQVVQVSTMNRRQQTSDGIGPGTSLATLQEQFPYYENACHRLRRGVKFCGYIPDPGEKDTWFVAEAGVITKAGVKVGLY